MNEAPKPPIGCVLDCTPDKLTMLNSNEKACRIQLVDNTWITVPPGDKAGLIVFLRKLPAEHQGLRQVKITEVGERVAFAEPTELHSA